MSGVELSGSNRSSHSSVFTGRFLRTQIQSCQSQRIWALPSSTPSRCMLPWQTLSLSTCACWTSTLNLLCLATPALSAQSVRLINKPYWFISCYTLVTIKNILLYLRNIIFSFVFIHLSWCRTCLPICGHVKGNDQGWDEHCKNELLSWHTWSESHT